MQIADLYDQPAHLLRRAQQISASVMLEAFSPLNITPAQFEIMLAIRSQPGIEAAQVTRLIGIDRSTLAAALERLERRGFVERHVLPHNRRAKQLYLSPEGNKTVRKAEGAYKDAQDRLMKSLSRSEAWQFMRLLDQLVSVNNALSRVPLKPRRAPER